MLVAPEYKTKCANNYIAVQRDIFFDRIYHPISMINIPKVIWDCIIRLNSTYGKVMLWLANLWGKHKENFYSNRSQTILFRSI